MRPLKRHWLFCWALLAPLYCATVTISARAADGPSGEPGVKSMTLQECLTLALEHNLSIKVQRINPQIAEYSLAGSYSIYDPTFQVEYGRASRTRRTPPTTTGGIQTFGQDEDVNAYSVRLLNGLLPTGTRYGFGGSFSHQLNRNPGDGDLYFSDVNTFGLEQPLLRDFWIDGGRAGIKINKLNLKQSSYDFEYAVMQTVLSVAVAYYDLVASHEEVRVQEKALELATKSYEEMKKKVEVGREAPLEEARAESQMSGAQADLINAQGLAVAAENRLKNLVTDNYEKWDPLALQPAEKLLAVPDTYDKGESWASALTRRPDFKAQRLELEKQGIEVKLTFNQLFPSLNVVGGYNRGGISPRGFSDSRERLEKNDIESYTVGAVLSIPLFNRSARYNHRIARETLHQQELELQALHQQIVVNVANAIAAAKSFFNQIPARRQARVFAERALDAEQKKLDSGRSTTFEVLTLQQELTQRRLDEIRSLTDYNKAQAELHFQDGTILERNRVFVETR